MHRLLASQEARRLLVGRSALIKTVVKIFGQQGRAFRFPFCTAGARELYPRGPMPGNDTKARRLTFAKPLERSQSDRVNVGHPLPDQTAAAFRKPGAHGISSVPFLLFRVLGFRVHAAEAAL